MDESPTVRAMADHLVSDAMIKAPALAHTHFLEVMCVLNDALDVWTALRRRSPVGASQGGAGASQAAFGACLLYTSPSPRDRTRSRMPSSA